VFALTETRIVHSRLSYKYKSLVFTNEPEKKSQQYERVKEYQERKRFVAHTTWPINGALM
jgi:hypothetical protein